MSDSSTTSVPKPGWSVTLDITFIAERHEDAMEFAANLLDQAADDPGWLSGSAHVPKEPMEFFDE